ncbi:MAG: T9SS type A sorting domain-containing protein, partial [Bacteroidota bacterium]
VNQTELNAVLQTPLLSNAQPLDLLQAPITEVARDRGLPTGYRLYENYPNPFNPTTTISYDLPADADVVLKVYDMLGREVTTLVEDRQTVGRHRILFDASYLSSGAYIYQIRAGSFTDRKKMLMLK